MTHNCDLQSLCFLHTAFSVETYRQLQQMEVEANANAQRKFDAAVDARDMPSGATVPPDPYSGD